MTDREKNIILALLGKIKFDSPAVYYGADNNIIDVYVYASGKTASATLFESFKLYKRNCIHVHSTKYFLDRILKLDLWEDFTLFDYINYMSKNANPLIIDVVREPISRKISAFFQHFTRFPHVKKTGLNREELLHYYYNNIEELIYIFNKYYLLQHENYYAFNEYINDGFDIKEYSFDHNSNYMYAFHNNKNFLILRFEDIKRWEDIIRRLGYKDFNLVEANKTDAKDVAELNKKFKSNYYVDKSLIDTLYKQHNDILKKFYTEEEINKFYTFWLNKSK